MEKDEIIDRITEICNQSSNGSYNYDLAERMAENLVLEIMKTLTKKQK